MTIVLTHQGMATCNDSITSVAVAVEWIAGDIQIVEMDHQNEQLILNCTLEGQDVFLLDVSCSPGLLDIIASRAKNVVLIDHHKTGFIQYQKYYGWPSDQRMRYEQITSNCHVIFNLDKSAALMAWEYFSQEPVPLFVQLISDGDLAHFHHPWTRGLLAYLDQEHHEVERWRLLLSLSESIIKMMAEQGQATLEVFDQVCEKVLLQVKSIAITVRQDQGGDGETHMGQMIMCPAHLRNRVCELMCLRGANFAVAITDIESGCYKISFRSKVADPLSFNVRLLAQQLGGGGHDTSSATKIAIQKFHEWAVF